MRSKVHYMVKLLNYYKMKKLFVMMALALPMLVSAQKFGYVNSSELFQSMPEVAVVRAQMDTVQAQYENQLMMMQEEFQKKLQDYQAQSATMGDAIRQIREQELQEMQQRIQTFYQTAEQDITKKQQELLAPVQDKLQKAIETVGAEQGFTYIFERGSLPFVGADAEDVQPAVRKKLGIK